MVLVLKDSHYQWLKPPPQAVVPGGWMMQCAVPPRGGLCGAGKQLAGSDATPSVYSYEPRKRRKGASTPSVHTYGVTDATPSVHTYCGRKPSGSSGPALCSPGFAKGKAVALQQQSGDTPAGGTKKLPKSA